MKGARSSRSIALVGRGNTDKLPPPAGNEVDAFLETLDHPLRDDIARVRRWVLDAAPSVAEAVHWSSPSFRVGAQFFATFRLQPSADVQLVLHTGVTRRGVARPIALSPAAARLVEWLSDDWALVSIPPARASSLKRPVTALVREWVRHVNAARGPAPVEKPCA
ncbi:MAG: DUF1801 domain-containing protein [Myxococcaceae bacterium]|jgi:hypothetical protein|nr:DUF1801 domain-containing protein [Myxococcaceae bacterium]